jgi:hypothetical protein
LPGWGKTLQQCAECTDPVGEYIIVCVAIAVVLAIFILFIKATIDCKRSDQFPIYLKILLNHLITASSMGEVSHAMPQYIKQMFGYQKQISRPTPQFASFDCVTGLSFFGKFLVVNSIPGLVTLILVAMLAYRKFCAEEGKQRGEKLLEASGKRRRTLQELNNNFTFDEEDGDADGATGDAPPARVTQSVVVSDEDTSDDKVFEDLNKSNKAAAAALGRCNAIASNPLVDNPFGNIGGSDGFDPADKTAQDNLACSATPPQIDVLPATSGEMTPPSRQHSSHVIPDNGAFSDEDSASALGAPDDSSRPFPASDSAQFGSKSKFFDHSHSAAFFLQQSSSRPFGNIEQADPTLEFSFDIAATHTETFDREATCEVDAEDRDAEQLKRSRRKSAALAQAITKQSNFHFFWIVTVVMLFFMYPSLVEWCALLLRCEDMDYSETAPTGRAARDIRSIAYHDRLIDCRSEEYLRYRTVALVLGLTWAIGIPVMSVVTYLYLRGQLGYVVGSRMFTFIIAGYRRHVWWWESVLMLRKALIILVVIFVEDSRLQTILAFWVIAIHLIAHMCVAPYQYRRCDQMEQASLFVLAGTLNMSLLFEFVSITDADNVGLVVGAYATSIGIAVINIGVVLWMLQTIVVEGIMKLKRSIREDFQEIEDDYFECIANLLFLFAFSDWNERVDRADEEDMEWLEPGELLPAKNARRHAMQTSMKDLRTGILAQPDGVMIVECGSESDWTMSDSEDGADNAAGNHDVHHDDDDDDDVGYRDGEMSDDFDYHEHSHDQAQLVIASLSEAANAMRKRNADFAEQRLVAAGKIATLRDEAGHLVQMRGVVAGANDSLLAHIAQHNAKALNRTRAAVCDFEAANVKLLRRNIAELKESANNAPKMLAKPIATTRDRAEGELAELQRTSAARSVETMERVIGWQKGAAAAVEKRDRRTRLLEENLKLCDERGTLPPRAEEHDAQLAAVDTRLALKRQQRLSMCPAALQGADSMAVLSPEPSAAHGTATSFRGRTSHASGVRFAVGDVVRPSNSLHSMYRAPVRRMSVLPASPNDETPAPRRQQHVSMMVPDDEVPRSDIAAPNRQRHVSVVEPEMEQEPGDDVPAPSALRSANAGKKSRRVSIMPPVNDDSDDVKEKPMRRVSVMTSEPHAPQALGLASRQVFVIQRKKHQKLGETAARKHAAKRM